MNQEFTDKQALDIILQALKQCRFTLEEADIVKMSIEKLSYCVNYKESSENNKAMAKKADH